MSLSAVIINKRWLSGETADEEDAFSHCREMELVCDTVTKFILDSDSKLSAFHNASASLSNRSYIMGLVNIQVLDRIIEYLSSIVKSFYKLNPKLARLKKEDGLIISKHDRVFDKLCSKRFILLQTLYALIMTILNNCLHREDSRKMIEIAFSTLTKHITPPTSTASRQLTVEKKREAFIENKKARMKQYKSLIEMKNEENIVICNIINIQNSDSEIPYISLLNKETVNSILQSEEIYIEILLDTAVNMAPALLGRDGIKKLKSDRVVGVAQASKKMARKVTELYQNVLWSDVGGCLEHIVLWWSPNTSQNLREWLMTFNSNNTPNLILSALRILADALGCHVTSTLWDKHFGATLTTNLKPTSMKMHPDLSLYVTECTESGANFALMLQELVSLSNQCEVTGDYILGAPLEELPIVEQIPILHRLDHSIHTCRLWCLAETRRLADMWAMDDFFRVTHSDVRACLEQLVNLRFADHTVTIESGKIGVHENVCAQMREKLVSEVRVNIQKLKEAPEEITNVLSAVCATTSLAHLSMLFPGRRGWQRARAPHHTHSTYVHSFMGSTPVTVN
ncbi:hypothetical protein EVAR_4003_1 [Eumeta japonica]|uniref:Coiled-coil protein 142 C-terminal domain-containing protein n=1 Tax=Eumeta variegata TaxID=151549 RepID=A0A4C1T764_EUMVA|nr:hypothetical protein EVAR_4003_1 [Eumeta japonica]